LSFSYLSLPLQSEIRFVFFMKSLFVISRLFLLLPLLACVFSSCDDGETYADMKNKERKNIERFIKDNDLVGPIKVISESTFYAQDSITDTLQNEYVLFNEDGIYMQIVRRGEGQTMIEMAKERPDSTVSKEILCRFMECSVESGDSTYTNYYAAKPDKMLCRYSHRGRTYEGSFSDDGYMAAYQTIVPESWLKPLDFIRLTRMPAPATAKVRLIVPHTSGTTTAQNYVTPYFYEITYQLGK